MVETVFVAQTKSQCKFKLNTTRCFFSCKMTEVRDLPKLNEDVLLHLTKVIVRLETAELEELSRAFRGKLALQDVKKQPKNISAWETVVNHLNILYSNSRLDIGWIHDARELYRNHWKSVNKLGKILLRRWCEGCGKEYYSREFTPKELEKFLLENWQCEEGCICEEYYSGLNWCLDCRYGTHDFIESDIE